MQVQQGRDDVSLEFALDDTGGDREDALVGLSFHVPKDAEDWQSADGEAPSVKVRSLGCERLLQRVVDAAQDAAAGALVAKWSMPWWAQPPGGLPQDTGAALVWPVSVVQAAHRPSLLPWCKLRTAARLYTQACGGLCADSLAALAPCGTRRPAPWSPWGC